MSYNQVFSTNCLDMIKNNGFMWYSLTDQAKLLTIAIEHELRPQTVN